jgi:uncharacterized membrane protein (UPF0127 family)
MSVRRCTFRPVLVQTIETDRRVRLSAWVPQTRRERARGLLARASLEPNEALLLERTRSVHTIGMRFHLAIALLDEGFRVLEVVRAGPGVVLLPRRGARHVLEAHPSVDLRPGDQIRRVS